MGSVKDIAGGGVEKEMKRRQDRKREKTRTSRKKEGHRT